VVTTSGRTLREARHRSRLSQAELARRAGVAQSVISAYESDRREPSLRTFVRLIEATGHQLDITITPAPDRRLGLPDTARGRRLRKNRQRIIDLAAEHGVHNVRVFGSVARGEDTAASDIDLLVDLDEDVSVVALAGVARELSALLHMPVDVIPSDALKPNIRKEALAEAVLL
jgi:uncharacterized protein